jgi:hypothetical protein
MMLEKNKEKSSRSFVTTIAVDTIRVTKLNLTLATEKVAHDRD